jgi:hypothetical protein
MRVFFLFVLFACCVCDTILLVADSQPMSQFVVSGTEQLYLVRCEVGAEYEMLVSWPASRPMLFELELAGEKFSPHQRTLLNTEKLVFVCSQSGEERVRLRVRDDGVLASGSTRHGTLPFTVCAKKRFAGIPISSFPVILTAAFIVISVLAWALLLQ